MGHIGHIIIFPVVTFVTAVYMLKCRICPEAVRFVLNVTIWTDLPWFVLVVVFVGIEPSVSHLPNDRTD